ncbi:MAG: hypothetical protein M3Y42_03290 [Actinomycetota bacterium]|nr:hypothetical protein [Actinomycetota bacterium]MDQ2955973.1 hypothetical protein [Actinomycetota bacterium]
MLAEMFQHDEAARRRWQVSAGFNVWIANLQLARADLDHTNMHALAARAEQLVSDHTGDLADTRMGLYLRDRLPLRYGVFEPHMGWRGGRVACYAGQGRTAEGEQVFLALFGSSSNVVGYRDDEVRQGEVPSDITGLYTMLDLAREPGDPEIDFEYRWDDGHLDEQARAETAIKFARMGARIPIGEHEFLARIFIEVDDYRYYDDFSGKVIVGTPLWIATPKPSRPR